MMRPSNERDPLPRTGPNARSFGAARLAEEHEEKEAGVVIVLAINRTLGDRCLVPARPMRAEGAVRQS
jgi:hypothetical protein